MARRNQEFQTIRSEGGLLPSDVLRRVIDPRGSLKGTRPEDYGLPQGERLNEVITQSWNRLRRHWSEFRAAAGKLPEGEAGTGLTNDKWSLPLLRELGFGLLPTSASPEIAGRTYAISRFFGSVPIHLVGCGLSLDRRAAGVRGAAGGNPHGLVQEVLNRSPDHLWGIVGNGLRWRILRDNQALSRQSFLEFDLEAMFSAEAYSDFVLLWLVAHATRFAPRDGNRIETCWLEEWTKEAQEQGTRALKDLRGSVERALQVLGEGFTSHPKNAALREALRSGSLSLVDFHGQLLRVVYRLIFLFVAEDRTLEGQPLLHPRDESESARMARERYAAHYGTARLRELAGKIKGSRHSDLWRQFQVLLRALAGEPAFEGTRRSLALPALGSFLWSPGSTADLNDAELTNHDFLEALRHLAYTRQGKVLRPVDYQNLGAEELGGVYESLLALTPQISADGARFTFAEFAGNERKTSGSYYTPDSLVQCLLDSALDPVVEDAIKGKTGDEAEQAILRLKVCDPAVGSGHFLVGAAHRLARHLARVRAQAQGESEPSPLLYQHALRDVIGRCLYGVDVNPMAAELCRVSLWLEALEPGKPLSFLDHHIRVGNSLFGATPALIAGGLPDNAFDAIEGDDKKICSALKKRNRLEREGQRDMLHLMVAEPPAAYSTLADQSRGLDEVPDATLDEIKRKAEQFHRLVVSEEYRHAQRIADAWCAAFVWLKHPNMSAEPPTSDTLHRLRVDGNALSEPQGREVECLASQYQFFHWQLAFPEVFAAGGFDLVLGNPPWDTLSPDAKEFFAGYNPEVRFRDEKGQKALIADLLAEREIKQKWEQYRRELFGLVHFLKESGRYVLYAEGNLGKGDFNIYRMFVELALRSVRQGGRCAQLVPEGIYNGANCAAIRAELLTRARWERLLGFENARGIWFDGIDTRMKFALYTAAVPGVTERLPVRFGIRTLDDLAAAARGETLGLPVNLIYEFSPDALAVMEFGDQRDIDIAAKMYARWPKFGDESAGPPVREYMREVDMGNDRDLFTEDPAGLPLYEGRMVDQYDHRAKGYRSGRGRAAEWVLLEFGQPGKSIQPQWRILRQRVPDKVVPRLAKYRVGFCDVTSPTNERSLVATLIPPGCVAGDKVPTVSFAAEDEWALTVWLAVANSFAMDYIARKKVALKMSYTVLDSLPFPRVGGTDPIAKTLVPLVIRLACCGPEMTAFWNARAGEGWCEPVSADGSPPGAEDPDERFHLRAQIDAIVARDVFGLTKDELACILDTFPIVRRKDEERYGEYLTKRVILEYYAAVPRDDLSGGGKPVLHWDRRAAETRASRTPQS